MFFFMCIVERSTPKPVCSVLLGLALLKKKRIEDLKNKQCLHTRLREHAASGADDDDDDDSYSYVRGSH